MKWNNLTLEEKLAIYKTMKDRPLTHWMGISDSLWGHITENRIRIMHLERILRLNKLTIAGRQDISDELRGEAQAQWYEAEKKEQVLTPKKVDKGRISWRFMASPLILFRRIRVWLSPEKPRDLSQKRKHRRN